MKNLRGQLEGLKENINFEYNRFRENKFPIDFAQEEVNSWEEDYKDELQTLLNNKDYVDMFEYDFFEFLPQIFYMNRNGEDIQAYVLHISKEDGIFIFCNDTDKTFYIGLNDITDLSTQIELLEDIENF